MVLDVFDPDSQGLRPLRVASARPHPQPWCCIESHPVRRGFLGPHVATCLGPARLSGVSRPLLSDHHADAHVIEHSAGVSHMAAVNLTSLVSEFYGTTRFAYGVLAWNGPVEAVWHHGLCVGPRCGHVLCRRAAASLTSHTARGRGDRHFRELFCQSDFPKVVLAWSSCTRMSNGKKLFQRSSGRASVGYGNSVSAFLVIELSMV